MNRIFINCYTTIFALIRSHIWKYTITTAFFIVFFIPTETQAVWFNSSWQYRFKVEVVPSQVGTTSAVTNFPVYFDLAGASTSFWSNVKSDGSDIRVVESDETTETAFELVSISTTTRRGELHFLADSLATTSTSTFYVYYGNSGASGYSATSTYGRNNVWTMYAGVWHLASGTPTIDSTGRNDLTANGSPTYPAGVVGTAVQTNGSTQYLRTGASPTGLPTGKPNMTYSFWVNWTSVAANNFAVTYGVDAVPYGRGYFAPGSSGGSPFKWATFWAGGTAYGDIVSATTIATGQWFHVVTTYDQTTHRMYRNAYQDPLTSTYTTSNIVNNYFNISKHPNTTANGVNGLVDEVRVASSTFDIARITTEYNNQSSTSTFFYIGPEETEPTPSATSTDSGIIWFE